MDDWMMAAGSSVTSTHCSVRYEVTWGYNPCVRPYKAHPHGRQLRSRGKRTSACMQTSVRADAFVPSVASPRLASPPFPCRRSLLSARMGCVRADADADARKKIN
jgi:hypothetical protein